MKKLIVALTASVMTMSVTAFGSECRTICHSMCESFNISCEDSCPINGLNKDEIINIIKDKLNSGIITTEATTKAPTVETTTKAPVIETTTEATTKAPVAETTTEVTTKAPVTETTTEATTEITTVEATTEVTTSNSYSEQVLSLVNAERAKYGLKSLSINNKLNNVAQIKAEDMKNNNYFSHTSPTYGSPFEMMNSFGISYNTAGENIAMGQLSPEAVVKGWMNSEGHRKNILNSSFTQMGLGYAKGNSTYWAQMFIG